MNTDEKRISLSQREFDEIVQENIRYYKFFKEAQRMPEYPEYKEPKKAYAKEEEKNTVQLRWYITYLESFTLTSIGWLPLAAIQIIPWVIKAFAIHLALSFFAIPVLFLLPYILNDDSSDL